MVPYDDEDTDLTDVSHYTATGLIAQEVAEIDELQHLVKEFTPQTGDAHYTMNYTGLIPYLVESIKTLKSRLDAAGL